MAEPSGFVDSPCTLARIDCESIVFEVLENFDDFVDMIVPISVKDADIIEEMSFGSIGTCKDFRHSVACAQSAAGLSPIETQVHQYFWKGVTIMTHISKDSSSITKA
jgi:hypothetical protein